NSWPRTWRASRSSWWRLGGAAWARPRAPAACRRGRSLSSPSGTRPSPPPPSAWATGSSATRIGAAPSAPSSPCPPPPPHRPAAAGKRGVPGGGLANGAGFMSPKPPARLARPDLVPAGTRTLNIVDVGGHLLDPTLSPPIKAAFIYNHNPLVVHPDQNRMRRG